MIVIMIYYVPGVFAGGMSPECQWFKRNVQNVCSGVARFEWLERKEATNLSGIGSVEPAF